MIKTYLAKHPEKKAIIISLGKYNSWIDQKEEEIELNFLQQIIYHVSPNKLPFSEINRIDMNANKIKIKSIFLSIFFLLLTEYIIFLKNFDSITVFFNNVARPMFFTIVTIILDIISIYPLHLLFIKIYSKLRNFKIKLIGKIEIESENVSIFRKSIGEFIHFFKQTDYNLVIFEDIDRLDNSIELFTKIKELNLILNNALDKKEIQFIYEINDSIFDSSEKRTKFFDSIIPIVSYTNSQESSNILQGLFMPLSKDKLRISDFEYIGAFTENSRIATDIYNEFLVYYKCNKKYIDNDRKFINLFYLISYKVLFPKKFDNLLKGEGSLAYYLTDSFKTNTLKKYIGERKEKLNSEITKLKQNVEQKFSEKIAKFLQYIDSLQEDNECELVFCANENQILKVSELHKNNELINRLNIDGLELCEVDNTGGTEVIGNEENIFNGTTKEKFFNEINDLQNNSELELLKMELVDVSRSVKYNSLEKKYIIDSLKATEKIEKDEYPQEKNLNDFEERLIEYDFIDPYYKTLLTVQKEKDNNTIATKLIIQDLLKGVKREYDLPLESAQYYVEVHKDEFNRDSFCMRDFYKVIVDTNQKELIDLIFNNLTTYKLNCIMKMEFDNIQILQSAKQYFDKIWEILEYNLNLSEEEIELRNFYIVKTFEYADVEQMKKSVNFINNVEKIKNIDTLIHFFYNSIKDNLIKYEFDFKQKEFDVDCTKFFEYIYDHHELKENISLFNSLVKNKGLYISEVQPLVSYYNIKTEFPKIFNYAMNHLQQLVLEKEDKLEDSEDVIVYLVNKGFLNNLDIFKSLISKEKAEFKDLSKIDSKFYQNIVECEKMDLNLNNLSCLYNNKEKLNDIDDILMEYANDYYNQLVKTSYDKKMDSILTHLIYELDIEINAFKALSDYYFTEGKYYTQRIPEVSIEKIKYLIDKNYMREKELDGIIKIDNSELLEETVKIRYIENSFNYIKDSQFDSMTISILEKILKSKIIPIQEKIDYALKYKEMFGDELYTLIAKNAEFDKCRLNRNDLLSITSNIEKDNGDQRKKVINCLYYNADVLDNDDLKNELSRIDYKFAEIFHYNGLPKYLDKESYNEEFLKILQNRGILKYEDFKKNSYIINRRTPRKAKKIK